ncbi:DUF6191 domain-containing protein [Streptomyces sp. NPDC001728]|uniref:DUF6191 domain-containing protein n=1 Tax=Streptomyces sp. NPDC001728 TaxID=3154396 RepID=UPI00332FF979
MFGGLDEFFAPGRRHTEEELRRQALTREDPGDADPSRGPIDLRSGRVTIRAARPAPEDGAADGTADGAADGGRDGTAGPEAEDAAGPEAEDAAGPEAEDGGRPAAEDGGGPDGTGGSEGAVEEVEAVGQGGGLAPAGDAELGEDVGDVDAGGLR